MVKLLLVFAIVMTAISRKKPIYIAISLGAAAAWLLYGISLTDGVNAVIKACTSWDTIALIVVVYVVSFLQNMMGLRRAIDRARIAISSLFNNRWVDCAAAPIFIGMLPTPNAAFIAGDIVKASAQEYLNKEEQAVVTSYFRHVSESFMPTYNSILTALVLSRIAAGEFVVRMLPMVVIIIAAGCFWFLRGKVPMKTGQPHTGNKTHDIKEIFTGLWPILFIICLVIFLKIDVLASALVGLLAYFFIHRFSFAEVNPLFKKSLQFNQYFNTIAIMVFKELLAVSGAVGIMTDFFSTLALPSYLIFAAIFFVGSIISSSTTMIVLCMPVAMAAVPGAGVNLLVLLMSVAHAAMLISPTHICLTLTADYFNINFSSLFKKTMPAVITTVVFAIAYYLLLTNFIAP